MYLGRIVEIAPSEILFEKGTHPYTRALLEALPIPNPHLRGQERLILEGELPSNIHPPSGCAFHPRCPLAEPSCSVEVPEIQAANEYPCHCRYSHCLACPVVLRDVKPEAQASATQTKQVEEESVKRYIENDYS